MSPTPTTTANQMQPMTSTASSTANQNANRSVGTTWANGNTGKVNIDLANLGKPVQQKKSASMNELKSQMPSSGNPGICSNTELRVGSLADFWGSFPDLQQIFAIVFILDGKT